MKNLLFFLLVVILPLNCEAWERNTSYMPEEKGSEEKEPEKKGSVATPEEDVQERAISTVKNYVTLCRQLTGNMRTNWLRWYRMVRKFRDDDVSTFNRVFLPLGWETVERIAPRMTAHDPRFEIIPMVNEVVPLTELTSNFLMWMWDMRSSRRTVRQWAKGALTYGTAAVKLDMFSFSRKEKVSEEVVGESADGSGEEVKETIEEVEIARVPGFDYVDIFSIDVDPRYPEWDQAPAIVYTSDTMRFTDLLKDKDKYFNLDKVEEGGTKTEGKFSHDTDRNNKLQARDIPASTKAVKKDKEVDLNNLIVREYYGVFSEDGTPENEGEYLITMVNDAFVIRLEKNPYATDANVDGVRPFVSLVDHDVPGESYGVGEIEPTESMQIGANKVRNQRLDNVDLKNNSMFLVDNNAGINPKQLVASPGRVVYTDDMNGLKPLPVAEIAQAAYAEEDRFMRDYQQATGVIDPTDRGPQGGQINTATGQKIQERESSSRFQLKIDNLESSLAVMGRKMLLMMHACMDEDVTFRSTNPVTGEQKFIKFPKKRLEEVMNGTQVRVRGGSTVSDDFEERRNDALAQYNLAKAAKAEGIIGADELAAIFRDVMRTAFNRNSVITKTKGGGLQSLLPAKNKANLAALQAMQGGGQGAPKAPAVPGGGQFNLVTGDINGLTPGQAI